MDGEYSNEWVIGGKLVGGWGSVLVIWMGGYEVGVMNRGCGGELYNDEWVAGWCVCWYVNT